MAYERRELEGIGGWLMFFILTLGVFTPLMLFYVAAFRLYGGPLAARLSPLPIWPTYRAVETAMVLTHVAVCWFLTWRLVTMRQWRTVVLTIIGIAVIGPGEVLLDWLVTVLLLGGDPGRIARAEVIALIRAVIYCGLWSAYLLRSKRVANTYRRDADNNDNLKAVFS